jgi:hypothetical protein
MNKFKFGCNKQCRREIYLCMLGHSMLVHILLNVGVLKTEGSSGVDQQNPQGIDISMHSQIMKKVSHEMP